MQSIVFTFSSSWYLVSGRGRVHREEATDRSQYIIISDLDKNYFLTCEKTSIQIPTSINTNSFYLAQGGTP